MLSTERSLAPELTQSRLDTQVDILHITDCGDGGVPAVIDLLLNRPGSRALFLGPLKAALHNAHLCSSLEGYTRSFHPLRMAKVLMLLRARILEINPRVIHLHSSFAGLLGAFVSLTLRRPVIYTPHASAMMIPAPKPAVRLVRQLERFTIAAASCVIACSRDEAALFAWSRTPVRVVPNAVPDHEMEILARRMNEEPAYEFDVIGIGRDSAQKDLEQFSEVADLLAQRIPGIRIGWLGANKRPGLSGAVQWLGYVSEQRVNEALINSRVFLATSVYEGFSVASIKAVMAGCDMVLRDKPGTRALAGDGIPCTLYTHTQECAAAIASILAAQPAPEQRGARMLLARKLYSQGRQLRWTSRIYQVFE